MGVSDFSLQKFNISIFVTEGLHKNSIPLGQPLLRKSRVHPQMYHSGGEEELMDLFKRFQNYSFGQPEAYTKF